MHTNQCQITPPLRRESEKERNSECIASGQKSCLNVDHRSERRVSRKDCTKGIVANDTQTFTTSLTCIRGGMESVDSAEGCAAHKVR